MHRTARHPAVPGRPARPARAARAAILVIAAAVTPACTSAHPAAQLRARPVASAPTPGALTPGALTPEARIPEGLLREARPIGTGPRFQPRVSGLPVGRCERPLASRAGVHVEVFAADRVLLLPAGIGARRPWTSRSGRIVSARCYGALVTLDPTGLVLMRSGSRLTLAGLFRSWGEPLSRTRLASFRAPKGSQVAVFVDGRPWRGAPGTVPLTPHAEIVLEIGPHVPPHVSYTFPPGT